MPDTLTDNFGLVKPEIGGSDNTWGQKLHDNYDKLDGLLWQPRRNLLINGAFDIWQRGTSFVTTNAFTADRWRAFSNTIAPLEVSPVIWAQGDPDIRDSSIQNYLHSYIPAYDAAGACSFSQRIENGKTLNGEVFTFSARVRMSYTGSAKLTFQRYDSTGTIVHTYVIDLDIPSGGWEDVIVTDTLPLITDGGLFPGSLAVALSFQGPVPSGGTVDISEVQLERGANATSFERRHIAEELALCQRYCWVTTHRLYGANYANGNNFISLWHPVRMRAVPTASNVRISGVSGYTLINTYQGAEVTQFYITGNLGSVDAGLVLDAEL